MREERPWFGSAARLVVGATLVAALLMATVVYWTTFRTDLGQHGRNPRVAAAAASPTRGRILDREGRVLAQSRPDGGRAYATAAAVHVVGYLSARYGSAGAELAYHDELEGSAAGGWLDALRTEFLRSSLRGKDVRLTIDLDVQLAAAEALGARKGAVVALDPRTGDVLAMVSWPNWDPNRFEELAPQLFQHPDAPLLNRATQGQYPPGSTFKVVTAAAALSEGIVGPDTLVTCDEAYVIHGYAISCGNVPQGPGTYPFREAFAYSVNAVFADIGVQVGWQRLLEAARAFGFGSDLGFPLPVTPSTVVGEGAQLDDVLLASTAFGQGEVSVSPLQMAVVAATVANGGLRPQPRLLLQVESPDGSVRTPAPPEPTPALAREVAEALRGMMVDVVRLGQADAAIPGVTVAGKTGTAETGRGTSHAWFIGFAPAEDPQVAVAVIVEDGGRGGAVAAPIARAVMEAALR